MLYLHYEKSHSILIEMDTTKSSVPKDAVIRFSGDSGDGMQLTGTLFSDTSALMGNDISTFPDYPAEIRAPQGTVAGVSGFQVHFGSCRIENPGDYCDVLVAMNPAALKANRKWLKKGATVIIDGDSITEEHIRRAGFTTDDPIAELGLEEYNVVIPDITTMTRNALASLNLDNKSVVKCKNMFALGICFFMFDRPEDHAKLYLTSKFAKKNPDIAELVRGKTGRTYGDLITLLTMLKGIPLAYNKDMQEDKEAIFDSVETTLACLTLFAPMISTMKVNADNMASAALKGYINATDLADYLVRKGLPFRSAYKVSGTLVAECVKRGIALNDLTLDELRKESGLFEEDVYEAISLETCLNKRTSEGAPSEEAVAKQLCIIKEFLDER